MRGRKRASLKSHWQELMEKGESFSRKEILVYYAAVFLISILLGLGMQLRWWFLLAGVILCVLQAPGMYFNYKKRMYEKRRFDDVNAYMSHMAQSFAGKGKILQSLKETRSIFPKGAMRQSLTRAIGHIENAFDVELAQQEALESIAKEYDCERIRTLHDFLLKAEHRGGSCNEEFRLLENIRQLWEQTALKYKNTVSMARNMVTFEYLLLILVCIFMLYQFPEELKILHLPLVQVLNTFLVVCFFFVFSRLDKKLSQSMLKDRAQMTEHQAEKKFRFIREFQGKKSLIRHLPYGLAVLVIVCIWFAWMRSSLMLALGIGICVLVLYAGHWRYFLTVNQVKAEIKNVFPCWLFDVLLLMQSENVSVALFRSAEKAPPVLKGELRGLRKELEEDPSSAEAFLSFLAEFGMPQVEGIMRKLYALSCGTGAGREVMNLIIDTNMTMLAEAEQQKLRLKGDLFSMYYMLPTIPVMVCMVGYGAALMYVIFQNIMTMI